MEALIYFAIWGVAIFVMMRFGCGAHVMGQGRKHRRTEGAPKTESSELRWVPPETDIDPVCGKAVATNEAKPTVHAGNIYYLCSRECREVFEVAPELYTGGPDGGGPGGKQPRLEPSHA